MAYYSEKKTAQCDVVIHAEVLEDAAKKQIELIALHPAISGRIAIMPDCHAGADCVVGFTVAMKKRPKIWPPSSI